MRVGGNDPVEAAIRHLSAVVPEELFEQTFLANPADVVARGAFAVVENAEVQSAGA
ncbi:hypothetical protein D3C85_1131430 [compost metagenome]